MPIFVLGTWYMVHGTWYLVLGTWYCTVLVEPRKGVPGSWETSSARTSGMPSFMHRDDSAGHHHHRHHRYHNDDYQEVWNEVQWVRTGDQSPGLGQEGQGQGDDDHDYNDDDD